MRSFHRRMYRNLGDFLTDMRTVMSQRKNIRAMMRGLNPAFRKRLPLWHRYWALRKRVLGTGERLSAWDIKAPL